VPPPEQTAGEFVDSELLLGREGEVLDDDTRYYILRSSLQDLRM